MPIRRCATDAAVIGIAIFGELSGPMTLAGSRPVDVCLQNIYGLDSGVFLPTLLHCLILTGAWFGALSRVCLHAFLPRLLLIFLPLQDMCVCMLSVVSPSPSYGLFFPPEGMRIDYEGALSRRLHVLT